MKPDQWLQIAAVVFIAGVFLVAVILCVQESRRWYELMRAYLEQRAQKKLVAEPVRWGEEVSSLVLPADLEEELQRRRGRGGLKWQE